MLSSSFTSFARYRTSNMDCLIAVATSAAIESRETGDDKLSVDATPLKLDLSCAANLLAAKIEELVGGEEMESGPLLCSGC